MPHLTAATVRRRLHALELQYLRDLTADLLAERDDLRARLAWAEDDAERWRDDALRAIEDAGCTPGLTLQGDLVAVPS